jgi:hypothetical protein
MENPDSIRTSIERFFLFRLGKTITIFGERMMFIFAYKLLRKITSA